jgi:ABC-type multidrug transport system fused ATPase/permease subunit
MIAFVYFACDAGQEPVLFSGTIRSNIANGKPDATDDDIIAACKQANAHDFIKAFPHAYSTECGEGGMQLSGGQKQRIVSTCSYIYMYDDHIPSTIPCILPCLFAKCTI